MNKIQNEHCSTPTMAIHSVIRNAASQLKASSDSPLLDAEVLLCFVLQKKRVYLKTWPERALTPEQANQFQSLVKKRRHGLPVAYLTGRREFWSREFLVTRDVLIPRPETELLIEVSLELIPPDQHLKLADLGTGSGIIAITLAAERPGLEVTATDLSPLALALARKNARQLNISNIQFHQSHWFDDLEESNFDFVVSNPPYIAKDDPHLQQGDLRFEPNSALISESQGLGCIETIANTARNHLLPGGYLLVEHGYDQQEQARKIFQQYQYTNLQTHIDLSGQPRVTLGQRYT